MAPRRTFTLKLCKRLASSLRRELGGGVEVVAEQQPFPGWSGRPDIFIRSGRGHRDSVVIVEVEHWSGAEQARKNIDQAYDWALSHSRARVAFVQFVNQHGNVDHRDLMDVDRRSPNWSYDVGHYAHHREDLQSSTLDVIDKLCSRTNLGKLRAAVGFAFAQVASPEAGERGRRPSRRGPSGHDVRMPVDPEQRALLTDLARIGYDTPEMGRAVSVMLGSTSAKKPRRR